MTVCPTIEELAACRANGGPTGAVAAHVGDCPDCRARLADLGAEDQLFSALREAVHSSQCTAPRRDTNGHAPCPLGREEIAGFEILEEIHRGGQGIVYMARQLAPNRVVALKVLLAGTTASRRERDRFEREVELAAALSHPNIVTILDTGTTDGRRYFTMEYVDGEPLDRYLSNHALDVDAKLRLFHRICCAVHHAHQRGVMHRDLKPANIMIDRTGEPRILDFGLAKTCEAGNAHHAPVTMTGEFMGTLRYASPEQAEGAEADVRTDVYSLGVVLYEMLTGQMPYVVNGDLRSSLRAITELAPIPPSTLSRHVDHEQETILLTALAKDKERRYPSAEAFARDIDNYLHGTPIDAKRDRAWYVLRKTLWRYRVPVALVALFAIIITAFAATSFVQYRQASRQATRALRAQQFLEDMFASAAADRLGPDVLLLDVLGEAEQRIRTELNDEPEIEAAIRTTLGRTYASAWRWHEAATQLQTALTMRRALHDGDHAEVAACLMLLGTTLAHLDQTDSVELLRQAHAMHRRLYAPENPRVLECTRGLADALRRVGDAAEYAEAEQLYEQALAHARALAANTDADRDMGRCLHGLGLLRLNQHRLDDADAMLRDAAGHFERLDRPDDPYAIELTLDLCRVLRLTGRYDESDALFRSTVSHSERAFGRVHTPFQMWRLGTDRYNHGYFVEAERLYRESLAISCSRMSEKYPQAWEEMNRHSGLLLAGGDPESSVDLYIDVFNTWNTLPDVSPFPLARGLRDLADVRLAQDDASGAEQLARRALELGELVLPQDHWHLAVPRCVIGSCLARRGRFDEAERLLQDCHNLLQQVRGPNDPYTTDARHRLIDLYERWDKPHKAAAYRDPVGAAS